MRYDQSDKESLLLYDRELHDSFIDCVTQSSTNELNNYDYI